LGNPKLLFPNGKLINEAVGAITGSGFIVGAWLCSVNMTSTGEQSESYVTIQVDGGAVIMILNSMGENAHASTDSFGSNSQGIGLMLRYDTGFVPSMTDTPLLTTDWAIIYIPD